jgi:hypothetical protein
MIAKVTCVYSKILNKFELLLLDKFFFSKILIVY